ncbi:hypothetical protein V494_06396 [Pseudogymnoascus sp. VKM F-4513 (FW-928)]|nr:hypothetical protein V494_06396 [Pseudogymnoascus sp. VKM F-4513 (FW-928)]
MAITAAELIPSQPPQPIPLPPHLDPAILATRVDVINGGSSGLIHLLPSNHIRKNIYPEHLDERCMDNIELESRIYQRLPKNHPRLLEMIRYSRDEGLVLEYMPQGDLGAYLRGEEPMTRLPERGAVEITPEQRLQWACDAAEGLQLLHENGVLHCDVRTANFLLDDNLRLKIIDFEGSSLDGCEPSSLEIARCFLPRDPREPSTAATELFALGSTIYEIMTGKEPYLELGDDEVTALFTEKKFPPVDELPCGDVIMKCWLSKVHSAKEVREFIEETLHDFKAKD